MGAEDHVASGSVKQRNDLYSIATNVDISGSWSRLGPFRSARHNAYDKLDPIASTLRGANVRAAPISSSRLQSSPTTTLCEAMGSDGCSSQRLRMPRPRDA